MKSKGVTTQMKSLGKHFLMGVSTSLLRRVCAFAICMCNLDKETIKTNLEASLFTSYTDYSSSVPRAATVHVSPAMMFTMIQRFLIMPTIHSRHKDTRIFREIPYQRFLSKAQVQLAANDHGFLYVPIISTHRAPDSFMENFHSTFHGIRAHSQAYLCKNRAIGLCQFDNIQD